MRDLLAHARRWGLAALAAAAVTLAGAAVASGTITASVGALGGALATSMSADSTTVAQSGGAAENPTPATVACPTCAIAITTASLPTPVLNRAYGQTIVATGGTAPVTFTVSSGSVPAGLSLAADGAITGTPTAAGPFSFTVKAADAGSNTATQTYSGTIASELAIGTTTLPAPVLLQAYSQTIAATGGTAPISFNVSGGSLPGGLSLADNGAITGTPAVSGPYSFTVKATDASSNTASESYSGSIATVLALATASLPTPVLSQTYRQSIAATGGVAPVTFAVSSGVLPAGLSLAPGGALTGTPTAPGGYSFTVKAADANGATDTQTYSGIITGGILAITTASLPTPVLNQAYNQTIAATGGAPPVTSTVSSGSLPAGMSLAPNGALTGTPAAPGAYSFTVKAADADGSAATQTYSGTIAEILAITTTSLPAPVLNQPYDRAIATTGGVAPVTFALSSGSLPAGLSLAASGGRINGNAVTPKVKGRRIATRRSQASVVPAGTISGTPAAAGPYSFTVKAADANGSVATQTYSGTVASILAITTATLPTPFLNQPYDQTIAVVGGVAPLSFSVSGGSLPVGLSLTPVGAVTGTPTASGAYGFTVTAADTNGATATRTYSGTIAAGLAITTASLPTPVLNHAYNQTIATSGGAPPISFSVSRTLPAGLYLADGAIAGIPTAAGDYSFTVKVADANGATAAQTYSGTIAGIMAIATTSLPTPVLNQPYNQTVTASGGAAPISLAVSDGTLPAGLSLADGVIAGTPTTAGPYSFTIKAADTTGATATQAYSGTIATILAITTTSLPTPVLNQAYNQTIGTTAGAAPTSLTVSDGTLPGGLYLADGAIAGTPTAAGAYSFTIKAADANGTTATQTYSGTIAAALAIATTSLPTPVLSQPYDQIIAAAGGVAPLSFSVSGGSLPAGLSLTPKGAVTGTPTASGAYGFTVTVAEANGGAATQTYSGTIAATLAIATASLPMPVLNQPYGQPIAAVGGVKPVSFSVSDGTLPAGLSLAGSAISGTPTAAGPYSFTIKAADANGITATQTYSGTIAVALAIATTSLPAPVLNQPYGQPIAAVGGVEPVSFSVSDGTLPAGLSLAGAAISGTPTAAGPYSFTVRAADANGSTATQTYSGAIAGVFAPQTYSGTVGETFAIATASLPTPALDQAYNHTIATSGGVEPVSFSVSDGTLPAGLSLAGGAIFGTPTAAGPYNFTVKAADANGATATQAYSGTITAALVANPVSATVVYNSTNNLIALNISGERAVGVTVSTPAGHGVAIANGTSIAYTPTSGYAGSDSFQYTAIGATSVSPPATVSITINAQAPVAGAVSATVGYNSTDNAISPDISGGPAASLAISTQAAHGKARARRTLISYTPTRGYAGSDSFQYTAANGSGESSPATVSITVNPQPPIARRVRETVQANSTNNAINLDITGGPPDSVAVTAPATQGVATAGGTSITYSPGSDFAGSDSFQYTATNAGGTSKAATVFVTVRAPAGSHEAPGPAVSHEAGDSCAALDPETSIAGCTTLIQSGQLRSTDLAVAYNNRGMAYDAQRHYDKAISDFTSAIGIKSDVAEVYFNRGVAYDSKEQTDEAIADYSRAIALRPDDAIAYIRRGKDYRGKSLADQAIADFTQAIRLRPSDADAYDDRAAAYSSTGRADQAIADLTQAIGLKPDFAQAYVDRGAVYMHKGVYDQAIADSSEAVKLKPNDAGAYVNRAAAYIGEGLYDQAIADATRAIALAPDDALAYNNRAVADNRKALFDQAIADATQAIALEPDYALAYLNRAIAEDARGRRDQTIADLRAALKIDPTLKVASDALARLGPAP